MKVDEIRQIEEKIIHTLIVIVSLLVYVYKSINTINKVKKWYKNVNIPNRNPQYRIPNADSSPVSISISIPIQNSMSISISLQKRSRIEECE